MSKIHVAPPNLTLKPLSIPPRKSISKIENDELRLLKKLEDVYRKTWNKPIDFANAAMDVLDELDVYRKKLRDG